MLEAAAALVAIIAFAGTLGKPAMRYGQILLRRRKIERFLIGIWQKYPDMDWQHLRRYVGQIAIETELTPEQVYDAAKGSKKLDRGSDGAESGQIWFIAKRPKSN